jgi:hypothetical protein
MTIGGRAVSMLLGLASAIIAFAVFRWWRFEPPPSAFYAGLAASAAGGALLLVLLLRIRVLLGREPVTADER